MYIQMILVPVVARSLWSGLADTVTRSIQSVLSLFLVPDEELPQSFEAAQLLLLLLLLMPVG
eukprot:scaffold2655_cov179-Amphora_coffeaeformis.AAC.10